jgi:hypothetical protein
MPPNAATPGLLNSARRFLSMTAVRSATVWSDESSMPYRLERSAAPRHRAGQDRLLHLTILSPHEPLGDDELVKRPDPMITPCGSA